MAATDVDTVVGGTAAALTVSVSAAGSYVVSVDGVAWLASGGAPDHLGRSLTVLDRANSTGEDKHGAFTAVTLRWQLGNAARRHATRERRRSGACHRIYTYAASELLEATQSWPLEFYVWLPQPEHCGWLSLGRFPSFAVGKPALPARSSTGLRSWAARSSSPALAAGQPGPRFRAQGAQETMPLVLYNRSLRAVAVSPSTNYFNAMHDTATSGGSVLAAGVMASIWTLPPGFSHTTLVVAGQGINATMTRLGAALLKETGKIPVNPRNESFVLSHLGYWVDNGAP